MKLSLPKKEFVTNFNSSLFNFRKNCLLLPRVGYPIIFKGSGGTTLFERKKHNEMDRHFKVDYLLTLVTELIEP